MNGRQEAASPMAVFYSYAHEDETLRQELEKHLSGLRRQGIISEWHDRQIVAGTEWAYTIDTHLNTASVILLLISPDFMASDYCYSIEMTRALERHDAGEAHVIPIILRPVDLQGAPFAHLQCLPRDAKPVTMWRNRDEAFVDIARGIRRAVEDLRNSASMVQSSPAPSWSTQPSPFLQTARTPPPKGEQDKNRQRMLERVRVTWIKGLLEQSLHGAVLIALGLHERPNAVANPWSLIVQELGQPSRPLPPGTRILQVYDDAGGELLILGEPGSGKTTLLLELTRDLLERAEHDSAHPIPVVFNLSSWAVKRPSLAEWLIEELSTKYQVPHKLSETWIKSDLLLPLLDGLDEVVREYRTACIGALNEYRREHGLMPMVVCSRSAEYLSQMTRVELRRAVVVQPLTSQQIDDYLSGAGEQLEAVRVALRDDPGLQEMAATPLMLSIFTLAYQGRAIGDLLKKGDPQTRRWQVFSTYVQRMFERRSLEKHYTPQQTIRWLAWLARQLVQRSQTEFYIERMQPDWLSDTRLRRRYRDSVTRLVYGTIYGLGGVLLGWLFGRLDGIKMGGLLGGGLGGGLCCGLTFGIVFGLMCVLTCGMVWMLDAEIKTAEVVTWSWRNRSQRPVKEAIVGLAFGLIGGLLGGLIFGVITGLILGLAFGLSYGLFHGLIYGLIGGLVFGLVVGLGKRWLSNMPGEQNVVKPHQGIWRIAYGNVLDGLVRGTVTELILGLIGGLTFGLVDGLFFGLVDGLVYGFIVGVFGGLFYGLGGTLIFGPLRELGTKIQPAEIVIWSWTNMQRNAANTLQKVLAVTLIVMLGVMLVFGLIRGIFDGLVNGLLYGLFYGLIVGLTVGLLTWVVGGQGSGWSSDMLDEQNLVRPNQGIRRSVRNSMLVGLVGGIIGGIVSGMILGLAFWLVGELVNGLAVGLTFGLGFGLIFGLVLGLSRGGRACIEHVVLRFLLWHAKCMPWDYPRFLDYAAERILLRKVGGGYIFVHRLLLEYFASLDYTLTSDQNTVRTPFEGL